MAPKPPSANVEFIDVQTGPSYAREFQPTPFQRSVRSKSEAGFDFLDMFGDMMRAKNFKPPKGKEGGRAT